jgi:hypothetical protein
MEVTEKSLGLSKMISKSSENQQCHSYENVQAPNESSHENKEKDRQHRNHEEDYINVQFDIRNGRRHLAVLGETRRQKETGAHVSAGAVVSTTRSTDRTGPRYELAKSNRQELIHSTGSKSWRVCSRTDSDSSSSDTIDGSDTIDTIDGSESPDAKIKELEHYNKLKLNRICPPCNKKALKGIKILTNANQPSLQAALHTSKHFKRRQQLSIPGQLRDTSINAEEKKQTIKYEKESHINHLLSVTGRPIRQSTSLSSRTVDDVHGVYHRNNT